MDHDFELIDTIDGQQVVCDRCGKSFPLIGGVPPGEIECLVEEPVAIPVAQAIPRHALALLYEKPDCVAYICSVCATQITFCKSGFGEPCVTGKPGAWVLPENPGQWIGDCDGA